MLYLMIKDLLNLYQLDLGLLYLGLVKLIFYAHSFKHDHQFTIIFFNHNSQLPKETFNHKNHIRNNEYLLLHL